jgi:hypothetical protein
MCMSTAVWTGRSTICFPGNLQGRSIARPAGVVR